LDLRQEAETNLPRSRLLVAALATLLLVPATASAQGPAECPGYEGDPRNHIVGTDGGDYLHGTTGDDILCGLGHWDSMEGKGGNDLLLQGDSPVGSPGMISSHMYGGPGDDVIVGGPGNEFVYGEGGNDRLEGGRGSDMLFPGPGADVISGGEGRTEVEESLFPDGSVNRLRELDAVSYAGPRADAALPVTVTLDGLPNDGHVGESDWVMDDVEGAEGDTGDDLLIGNSEGNFLNGYLGDDVIIGNGGRDGVLGMEGNDWIDVYDGNRREDPSGIEGKVLNIGLEDDSVGCGGNELSDHPSRDVVIFDWDDIDFNPPGCEKVIEPGLPEIEVGDGRVVVPVECRGVWRCKGSIKMRVQEDGHLLSGKKRFDLRPGDPTRKLVVRLRRVGPGAGAAAARKRAKGRASIRIGGQNGALLAKRFHRFKAK
jgi:hypothetical protein